MRYFHRLPYRGPLSSQFSSIHTLTSDILLPHAVAFGERSGGRVLGGSYSVPTALADPTTVVGPMHKSKYPQLWKYRRTEFDHGFQGRAVSRGLRRIIETPFLGTDNLLACAGGVLSRRTIS